MKNIKFLLFDCIETIIDIREKPGLREYALWSFEGSGNEKFWVSFEEFFEDYKNAVEFLSEKFPDFREYNMLERFKYVAKNRIAEDDINFENIISNFSERYWERYKSECYIRDEVKSSLFNLSKRYGLGIVSNFKVRGGIEELLKSAGKAELFKIKIVSVNIGWRKPDMKIYNTAKEEAGLNADEILFIGDDFECDYIGPKKAGMNSILLDRSNEFSNVEERIKDFYQLDKILAK
jgi:putative hydrolase of the HAD superfamily